MLLADVVGRIQIELHLAAGTLCPTYRKPFDAPHSWKGRKKEFGWVLGTISATG